MYKYISNNILEYCNNIEIFIGSKYVNEKKLSIWKEIFINKVSKVSNVLYNTDNDINLFFTFIVTNLLKKDGFVNIVDLNKSKISKEFDRMEFINAEDIEKYKNNKTFDIIFISDSIAKNNIKYIFLEILNRWLLLEKNGIMLFDNLNEIYQNYKYAYESFYKLFFDEIQILYIDYSNVIIKKLN